jgi:hypothetical protein
VGGFSSKKKKIESSVSLETEFESRSENLNLSVQTVWIIVCRPLYHTDFSLTSDTPSDFLNVLRHSTSTQVNFCLYPAYNALSVCYDHEFWTLTLKSNRILSLMMINHINLYNLRAYDSVSILCIRLFHEVVQKWRHFVYRVHGLMSTASRPIKCLQFFSAVVIQRYRWA